MISKHFTYPDVTAVQCYNCSVLQTPQQYSDDNNDNQNSIQHRQLCILVTFTINTFSKLNC